MFPFYLGVAVFILLSIITLSRVRSEYQSPQKLSTPTVVIVWGLYFLHAGLTVFAAWRSIWTLPVSEWLAILTGGILILFGSGFFTAGILEFRSFQRMSGQRTDQLVSSGVYRWSRNPQNVGWIIFLTGVALIGKSGSALVLIALFAVFLHIYIVYVEEAFLEIIYGEAYRLYRTSTARYLGIPGDYGHASQVTQNSS